MIAIDIIVLLFALLGLLGGSIDRRPLIDCAPTVLAGSNIAEQRGLGIKAVQESLGHRNLNSTETYLRKQRFGEICIDLSSIGAES